LRLPPFKEAAPRAWFKQAEAYFRIHGKTGCELWYFYVTWALSPQQEALVQDITEAEITPPNAYELLKERLLQLHEKGERARAKKLLLHMAPIGGRRPSKLLAEILSLCPKGEQGSNLMRYLFFFCLPPRIQELLGENDHSSVVELAARADKLTWDEAEKAESISAVEELMVAAAGPPPPPSASGNGRPRGAARRAAKVAEWTPTRGRAQTCAIPTTCMVSRPVPASHPAHEWETNGPGPAQRRCCRDPGTRTVPAIQLALSCGHRSDVKPAPPQVPPAQRLRHISPNGQPIHCWGKEHLQLQLGSHTFWWNFLKADVTFPILGVDFLRSNHLSVSVETNQLVDVANIDTEQPSGYTASVMLRANVREEMRSAVAQWSPPPWGGPKATYAAAASRGTPPPGNCRRGRRGHLERGLHLHQEAAAPSCCPRMGRQRQGGCNLNHLFASTATATAAPAQGAERTGNSQLRPGAYCAVPGCPEPIGQPEVDHGRCGPPPAHPRAADRIQVPAAGRGEAGHRQKRIPHLGEGRDSVTVEQPLGIPPAHGEEAGRQLALLRQLPVAQQHDGSGHLPYPQRAGFRSTGSVVYPLLKNQPEEGVSSGADEGHRHPQDGHQDTVQPV